MTIERDDKSLVAVSQDQVQSQDHEQPSYEFLVRENAQLKMMLETLARKRLIEIDYEVGKKKVLEAIETEWRVHGEPLAFRQLSLRLGPKIGSEKLRTALNEFCSEQLIIRYVTRTHGEYYLSLEGFTAKSASNTNYEKWIASRGFLTADNHKVSRAKTKKEW